VKAITGIVVKLLILAFGVAITCGLARAQEQQPSVWQPSAGRAQVPIWPGGMVPDAQPAPGPENATSNKGSSPARSFLSVTNVSQPTMTVYSPTGKTTGAAVVVFPGGGYQVLAIDLEGTEICDWLVSKGITAVLLKYRVPLKRAEAYSEPTPQALEDAQRTLGLVRFHAAEWQIDPHKIGVIGFSAGGHMVAAVSTHFEKRVYAPVDEADQQSCRPDFAIACYPGHLWDEDNGLTLNPNVPVNGNTPPTFLLQAENDPVDSINHSLVYYMALKKAGVPVEMHLYAQGGHGFGLRPTTLPISQWPDLAETWLRTIGMIPK
jgi:acetyl esterase/lipase